MNKDLMMAILRLMNKIIKQLIYVVLILGFVEILHYVLKELIYLEAITILSAFIIGYIIIISLFIAKKRDNFFIKHYILTFFFGIVVYNYVTYPSYTYRYRMTVEVETSEGIRSGSSIVELHRSESKSLLFGNIRSTSVKGEGTAVEVEKDKTLVVLLQKDSENFNFIYKDHAYRMFLSTFPISEKDFNYNLRRINKYYGTLKNAKGILPKEEFPLMLTVVKDKSGKSVVHEVDSKNISDVFGNDVKFRDIIIETTNEPISETLKDFSIWGKVSHYLFNRRILPIKN